LSSISSAIRARAQQRGVPSLAEAISATGGVALALGILLITIDLRAAHGGRGEPTALFAALVLAGYVAVWLLPTEAHAAGVAAIVLGIPGALGWLILPGAHRFADIRPFIVLTIAGWIVAFVVPHTRGRTIFIAAAALLLWLWVLGEVADTGAYSASPIPSPPAHTVFSLQSLTMGRSAVEFGGLDSNDPLYSIAKLCNQGNAGACRALYAQAEPGSDFQDFASTCGNTQPAGACAIPLEGIGGSSLSPVPGINPIGPISTTTDDKSLEIGLVSVFFGVLYLGALFVLDRAGWRGLATAFVVPGVIAMVSGTQSLGNAAHHAWAAGLLTFAAGIAIGGIGDRTRRRFTTWAGAVIAAVGALTIALDASHVSHSVRNGEVKLAGPGLVVVLFGVGLAGIAFVVAHFLGDGPAPPVNVPQYPDGPAPPPEPPPPWPSLPSDPSTAWPPRT
jgi:hypothetical protein